jgi:hypothetical protein
MSGNSIRGFAFIPCANLTDKRDRVGRRELFSVLVGGNANSLRAYDLLASRQNSLPILLPYVEEPGIYLITPEEFSEEEFELITELVHDHSIYNLFQVWAIEDIRSDHEESHRLASIFRSRDQYLYEEVGEDRDEDRDEDDDHDHDDEGQCIDLKVNDITSVNTWCSAFISDESCTSVCLDITVDSGQGGGNEASVSVTFTEEELAGVLKFMRSHRFLRKL